LAQGFPIEIPLRAIVRNCEELKGLAIARKKIPIAALETLD